MRRRTVVQITAASDVVKQLISTIPHTIEYASYYGIELIENRLMKDGAYSFRYDDGTEEHFEIKPGGGE